MCGGMFGDTSRSQETQDQREARLEKQAKAAVQAKLDMEKKLAEMADKQARVEQIQDIANKAVGALQNAKENANKKTEELEIKNGEVDELENKINLEKMKRTTKEKETDLLKIKESEQEAEIKSLKNQKVENDEKLSNSQAESELAEAHAHSLAKEVDAMDQSPSQLQAKTDAKLLEGKVKTKWSFFFLFPIIYFSSSTLSTSHIFRHLLYSETTLQTQVLFFFNVITNIY